jgi:hypothetical protein
LLPEAAISSAHFRSPPGDQQNGWLIFQRGSVQNQLSTDVSGVEQ